MRFAKHLFPSLIILLTVLAFACPALAESEGLLVLPKNMQFIKSEAFRGATAFERVIITEGAHTIESNAFAGSNLKQIQLPVSMSNIADDAFGELKPLVIAVKNTYPYGWANGLGLPVLGCTVNAEENCATIVSYNGTLSTLYLPDEVMGYPVTAIASNVFKDNAYLEKVILPESLTTISNWAFLRCAKLTDIVFNNSLTTINLSAFEGCSSLQEADLPDSVKTIGSYAFKNCSSLSFFDYPVSWANTNSNNDDIFYGCTSLKSITVPNGVTTLPVAAFAGANKLESVILPESLTSVSNYAFAYATALKSISIPASVETIGEFAVEVFLTATTGPLYKGIKIINLSKDVLKELLDLYGDSENYWSYKAMCETFSNARSVFSSRFEELQANPENGQLIAALVNDFNVTKRSAERALTALTEMKKYEGVNYDYVSSNLDDLENMSLPFLNKTVLV